MKSLRQPQQNEELILFVKWLEFLKWLLPALEKFPKKSRFTITNRIENLALDIVELFIEAKYQKEKVHLLKKANLYLEKIRVLFRISYDRKLFSTKAYNFSAKGINEVGILLGGWLKQQKARR
ncbi:MAG: diversity-generating retroelement protein Avd [Oligoflexia bacterium]|nr:diversity-generating retroelement protein Avd [Oligoflexia bacterium]